MKQKQVRGGGQEGAGRASTTNQEVDLKGSRMPPIERARLITKVREYACKHPEEANQFQRECHEAIEAVRPPNPERTLRVRRAAKRIAIAHKPLEAQEWVIPPRPRGQ